MKPEEQLKSKEERLEALRRIKDKHEAGKVPSEITLKWGSELKELEFIPTGLLAFDSLCGTYNTKDGAPVWTGRGGLARGRFTIWWGSRGCGKTTMALRQTAKAQEAGGVVGYWDSENALEPIWTAKQGVNMDELLVWQGGNLEKNMDSMIEVMDSGALDMLVIDTIHAFATAADLENKDGKHRDMGDEPPQGRLAAKLSRFFRMVTHKVARANCAVLILGQARAKDDFEQLTGGHALMHYNSLNLHFIRSNDRDKVPARTIPGADGKNAKVPIGFNMIVKVDKTRLNHRDQDQIMLPFLWGVGPDHFETNVMASVRLGIIKQAGAYYSLPTAQGEQKIQGKEALLDWVKANPNYYEWLLTAVTGDFQEPADKAPEPEAEEEDKPKKKGKKE